MGIPGRRFYNLNSMFPIAVVGLDGGVAVAVLIVALAGLALVTLVVRRPRSFSSRSLKDEQQIMLLLDSTREAIYGVDRGGSCLFCNPACLRLLGYEDQAQLLGKNMHSLIHHTRAGGGPYLREECPVELALRRGEGTVVSDELLWRADGTSFPAEYWSYPLREDEKVTGAVVAFVDITERKDAESRLERFAAELGQANRDLHAANQALKDFVSMASHDLREPITSVLGFASQLLEKWDAIPDPDKQRYLSIIERRATQLAHLVDDLLTVSRIEAGILETHGKVIEVRAAIEQTAEEFAPNYGDVEISAPAKLAARADPDHLERILGNYLHNAFNHGSPPVRVEVAEAGGWVEIRVRDHGDGVPNDFAPRLFQRFSRGAVKPEGQGKGTGLGLFIVRALAQAGGGEAWYEPNHPTGACFGVRFPKAD